MVEYYGTPTPLLQIAGIHATDARTLTIQPWDKKALPDIEKAIQKSDHRHQPDQRRHGHSPRCRPSPRSAAATSSSRSHKKLDEAKVAVRNIRRDAHDHLRAQEKSKEITADDLKQETDRLQKLTDRQIAELDQVGQAKEREIMEI